MPKTPDSFPGPLREDEIRMYDQYGSNPPAEGCIIYSNGYFRFYDGYGIYNPREMTEVQHSTLRQLIHFIDEGPANSFASGAYKEVLPVGHPFPTQVIWWESDSKSKKIVEKNITRNPNKTPSVIEWKMYDTDGSTIVETVTDTITYSAIFEVSRIRSIS